MASGDLNTELNKKVLGSRLWVVVCLCVGAFIVLILCILSLWVTCRKRSKRTNKKYNDPQIPYVSKDIKVDKVGVQNINDHQESLVVTVPDKLSGKNSETMLAHLGRSKSSDADSQCSSMNYHERPCSSQSGEEGSSGTFRKQSSYATASPLIGLPEMSHLGWGHWFTLRDLQLATNRFSAENVIGEGGYGVVYHGTLVNGTEVAVKKLLNNLGQAEREFRVEVEAIGHVRHKNLVRLLGYCVEGVHRMLVYEYMNNGNLEQWLHGAMREHGSFTWEARMKVLLGTAKALAYLHEAIEPKVIHRDIKSSNILIDHEFNSKVSDFGLAKLLDSGESHVTTRVMGTFGYVAPEYANTGLLNEKSDIYSFGVLLLEAITGRDPVDYSRPANEVNLVEWLKMMVGDRRAEEVLDPNLENKPPTRALKCALLVALRCVDPDSQKRPKMSQVVRMLEADDFPHREDRRNRKIRTASMEVESLKEGSNSAEVDSKSDNQRSDILHE
ncbi:Receptor-like kinase lip2 [Heracleum sosnowskyi]|uniref:non-specific serine/threonine protein kinase n=1 Tax=Heracleum sosnowskyi TaxID=360622 RepID=A0AAD8J3W1_9APIA|nr:Receptor-like kinase lip2 [Heracleum sosnowskyi]